MLHPPYRTLAGAALAAVLLCGAWAGPALPAPSALAAPLLQDGGLTQEALADATYQLEFLPGGEVTLTDGAYESQPGDESSANVVVQMMDYTAWGDLDGDGDEDAAVLLATNTGGSGTFVTLHAVLNEDGRPVDAAQVLLGDRVQVNSLAIEEGAIVLDGVTHGPEDPMCCPTQQVVLHYTLVDGALVLEETPAADAGITQAQLANLTYTVDGFDAALVEGVDEDGATGALYESTGWTAWGDLNGDGEEDAVTVLAVRSGDAVSYLLAPVLSVDGEPTPTDTLALGDVRMLDGAIVDGQIVGDLVVDGMQVRRTYALEGATPALVGEVELGPAEAPPAGADVFDPQADATVAALKLGGDAWLDPTLISLRSGGSGTRVDAAALGPECIGVVGAAPDVTIDWVAPELTGAAATATAADDAQPGAALRFFFLGLGDATLAVVTPAGDVLCNDDFSALTVNPGLALEQPEAGRYALFVGSADAANAPGFLVATTAPFDPTSFDPGALVARPAWGHAAVGMPLGLDALDLQGVPTQTAAAAVAAAAAPAGEPLDAANTPAAAELVAGGSLPAFAIPFPGGSGCTGFITAAPGYRFTWADEENGPAVFFEAGDDTALIVLTPDGQFACNDDAAADNLNPALELPPAPGDYAVWVAGYSPQTPITGTLTVAGDSARPAQLTPDMLPSAAQSR